MKLISKRSDVAAALLASLVPATSWAASPQQQQPAATVGYAAPVAELPSSAPAIPARGRYVLVDATSAELFMIENGKVVDSMRVIVGKPTAATPTLRSTILYATLNPYWNVPVDLARTIIAPRVMKEGTAYLAQRGYEVVTGFGTDAQILPADSVDWRAVADGREKVYVRQLPGPANSMGRMKFGLVDNGSIFLHDTPNKELFGEPDRSLSNGCVRLEDAPRLARWMLGRDPGADSAEPEQHVALQEPVHIILTSLDPAQQMELAALR